MTKQKKVSIPISSFLSDNENYLKQTEKENRKTMTIYTVKINEDQPSNKQLNLFDSL